MAAVAVAQCVGPATAIGGGPAYAPQHAPDTAAPVTTIERSFLRASTRTVKFWFSASEAVQGFRCRLDDGEFKGCGSPRAYRRLKPGRHAFRVKAVDLAGNVGAPALVRFRVPRPRRNRR